MRIFLVGFMGSGKTTVAKKLAGRLNLRFLDLDDLIEKKQNKTVNEIFQSEGEEAFRKMEHEQLTGLSSSEDFVLSTGGGAPCYHNNMNIINKLGRSVYLKMTPAALCSRLIKEKNNRPLIKNLNEEELLKFIETKLNEREPFYQKAHLTVNALSIDISTLIEKIQSM